MGAIVLALDDQIIKDPFKAFFEAAINVNGEPQNIAERINFLEQLNSGLSAVISDVKGAQETATFQAIGSAFATAATFGAWSMLPFPLNLGLCAISLGATVTGGGASVSRYMKTSPITEELQRHSIALTSAQYLSWACLWELCGETGLGDRHEVFRHLLYRASRGSIFLGASGVSSRIRRDDGESVFYAALNTLKDRLGRKHVDEIGQMIQDMRDAFFANMSQVEIAPLANAPTQMIVPSNIPADAPRFMPEPEPIGSGTRINAIETPASCSITNNAGPTIGEYLDNTSPSRDIEQAIEQARSMPEPGEPIGLAPWEKPSVTAVNPLSTLGDKLSSLLIIAPTGAGKGILMSNLTRHFYAMHPTLKIFAFEGKNDPNETGYWSEGFTSVVRVNLDNCQPTEAANAILYAMGLVSSVPHGSPSILLIDEANALITVLTIGSRHGAKEDKELCSQALGEVMKKISTAATTGQSAQKFVWVIGQNPNLGALGLNGGDAAQLRKVAIALPTNPVMTDQIIMTTGFTGKRQDQTYRSMVDDLMETSPVDRAYFDSARVTGHDQRGWFPMDRMTNYSGYDRDSLTTIGVPPSVNLPKSKILSGHGSTTNVVHETTTLSHASTTPVVREEAKNADFGEEEVYGAELVLRETPALSKPKTAQEKAAEMQQNIFAFISESLDDSQEIKPRDLVRKFRLETKIAEQYLQGYGYKNKTECRFVPASTEDARIGARLERI